MAAVAIFFSALCMFLFLRERRFSFFAALVGGISMGFSTTLVSMVKAGHLGKLMGVAYIVVALWLMERSKRNRSWKWTYTISAGLCTGLALAWGRDTSMLVLIGVVSFWIKDLIYEPIRKKSFDGKQLVLLIAPLIVSGVLALGVTKPVLDVLKPQKGNEVVEQMSEQAKWEWATQWSLPSDELIKLVCSSYYGWDSWDSGAPYWGKMGRSAGWEQTGKGFRNFTQTNEYTGIVTTILSLTGFFISLIVFTKRRNENPENVTKAFDGIFWGVIGIIALLLAMGNSAPLPLYKGFYMLPVMASIRNPVKFMHLVSLALAILSAHGVDSVERTLSSREGTSRLGLKVLLIVSGIFAGIFLLSCLTPPWTNALQEKLTREGFGQQYQGIQMAMLNGILTSLVLSLLFVILAWVLMSRFAGKRIILQICAGFLLIMLASDFLNTNRHYVKYEEWRKLYQSNCVFDYLKTYPNYRVKFIPHNWNIFNYWNNLLIPFFEVRSADVPASSRPKKDIEEFYQKVGRDPARLWQLLGIRNLILPKELESELIKMLGNRVKAVKCFDFRTESTTGSSVIPVWVTGGNTGNFRIYEYPDAIPVASWYGDVKLATLDDSMNLLASKDFDVAKTIIIAKNGNTESFAKGNANTSNITGQCTVVKYSGSKIRIKCSAAIDGLVMINDYYNSKWKAMVDNSKVSVMRADGIFMAVPVPAGTHEISMKYKGNIYNPFSASIAVAVLVFIVWVVEFAYMRRSQIL
ncbi:MAG: YfhO family protein [Kiritimatiellae bacterium]|nr:YfhO family protein [Kiritimatiellia bacterium]